MIARLLLLFAVALGLGCQTALDLEMARGWFQREQTPEVPVLVEAPEPTLPAPEGLRATEGELRRVPLRWDPVLDAGAAGYVVERAPAPDGPFERVAVLPGRFRSAWVDEGSDLARKPDRPAGASGLGDGQRYTYRVRAFDHEGRLASPPSAAVTAQTAAPPAPPEALHVYSHLPRRVALAWDPSPDGTTEGYVVLRSPTARGDFLPIQRLKGRYNTIYEDRGLGDLRVFYYRVASQNAAGAEGPPTAAERAVTKPVPLPPDGLALRAQRVGVNRLAWRPNVEEDLEGYRLMRKRQGEDAGWETVAVLPAGVTAAEDPGVAAGERVTYAVVAFDRDGLESARSQRIPVDSLDYGLRAEVHGDDVRLSWDPAAQEAFAETRVLREGLRTRELARVSGSGFVDAAVSSGRRTYRIVGIRPDGSEAPPSRPIEVEVADAD